MASASTLDVIVAPYEKKPTSKFAKRLIFNIYLIYILKERQNLNEMVHDAQLWNSLFYCLTFTYAFSKN